MDFILNCSENWSKSFFKKSLQSGERFLFKYYLWLINSFIECLLITNFIKSKLVFSLRISTEISLIFKKDVVQALFWNNFYWNNSYSKTTTFHFIFYCCFLNRWWVKTGTVAMWSSDPKKVLKTFENSYLRNQFGVFLKIYTHIFWHTVTAKIKWTYELPEM